MINIMIVAVEDLKYSAPDTKEFCPCRCSIIVLLVVLVIISVTGVLGVLMVVLVVLISFAAAFCSKYSLTTGHFCESQAGYAFVFSITSSIIVSHSFLMNSSEWQSFISCLHSLTPVTMLQLFLST